MPTARRRIFAEGVFQDLIVHPVSLDIAQRAGRIEGEQAAAVNATRYGPFWQTVSASPWKVNSPFTDVSGGAPK